MMNTPQLLVVIVGGDAHIRGSRFLDSAETARRTMRIPTRRRYLVGGIVAAAVLAHQLGLHRRVCVGLAAGAR
jgi:hypothetical protein